MPNFKYVAYTNTGKQITGAQEANKREDVADYLHKEGYTVISISENLALSFKSLGSFQIGGIPLRDKVIFAKQLSVMLSAGVPMIQALRILVDQAANPSIKQGLEKVYREVEAGNKLSDAFEHEKSWFNEIEVNLLRAGEKSGNLNVMMQRIAENMEKTKDLQGKIKGAMIYPVIIFFVLVAVIGVVVIFMIPAVSDLYKDLGQGELPGVTLVLLNISKFVTNPLGIISLTLGSLFTVIAFRYYNSTPNGRHNVDKVLLHLPIVGTLSSKIQVSQFCTLLSLLTLSGVPIIDALNIVAKSMSNIWFREVLEFAAQEVAKGTSISVPLAKNNVMPGVLLKIIATGEETGKLDQVLVDMGKFYAKEADEITDNLTKLMEPLILLIVGVVVGFIAVAVYLPIYSLGAPTG